MPFVLCRHHVSFLHVLYSCVLPAATWKKQQKLSKTSM